MISRENLVEIKLALAALEEATNDAGRYKELTGVINNEVMLHDEKKDAAHFATVCAHAWNKNDNT